jgi:hypothetical protein
MFGSVRDPPLQRRLRSIPKEWVYFVVRKRTAPPNRFEDFLDAGVDVRAQMNLQG